MCKNNSKCVETSVETSGELETVGNISKECLSELKQMLCGEIHPCNDIGDVTDADIELVTRSQAVELLAAERAENTRLQSENDAQADQISELQMTPWPEWATKVLAVIRKRSGYDGYGDAIEGVDLPAELDECIAAIEADNAAKVEQERLRFEGDLDKWMKIIGAGITGYQPEAYALMDLACHELVKLRSDISAIAGHVDCEADSDSILHIIRDLEADNAALTARVKELETALDLSLKKIEKLEEKIDDIYYHADRNYDDGHG